MANLTKEQLKIHFVTRRNVAMKSFWLILIVGGALLAVGISSDEGAARVEKLTFLVGTLFSCWTAIVLAYFGASSLVDNTKLKK